MEKVISSVRNQTHSPYIQLYPNLFVRVFLSLHEETRESNELITYRGAILCKSNDKEVWVDETSFKTGKYTPVFASKKEILPISKVSVIKINKVSANTPSISVFPNFTSLKKEDMLKDYNEALALFPLPKGKIFKGNPTFEIKKQHLIVTEEFSPLEGEVFSYKHPKIKAISAATAEVAKKLRIKYK